jgi:TolB-like protein
VIKEFQLSQSGIIDTSYAKQIGKITGADAIVTGSVIKIGNSLRLDARIIDVESGIILTAEKCTGELDIESIGKMAELIVANLAKNFYEKR